MVDTLNLKDAAALLKIHPVTLQSKAKSGEVPGAKVGRSWVFVQIDLLSYIRSKYVTRMVQGDTKEKTPCHSTNVKTRPSTGSKSQSTDEQYRKALALPTR
ncbi:MAG: hypothetical protein A2522_06855 [Gallionellales bacterium RIFOXYD12_FULL_53_10]|nr:MAG: hypothetical protein A2522_06855 [Gallionellales bacterium RIFOXYD12_FULL_53_10]